MANEVPITWRTTTDFSDLTNLQSLASGNIWHSETIDDASPTDQVVRISYELIGASAFVAGDSLIFRHIVNDEAASNEIRAGDVSASEAEVSVAADIAEIQAGCPIVWEHAFQTSHGTTYKGAFDIWLFGPSWQLAIELNTASINLSTGNRLRFRYGVPDIQ